MNSPELSNSETARPKNRSLPDSDVIPVISYPEVREAAEWLSRAFGFSVRLRIADHRIQLNAGSGALVVRDGYPGGDDPGNRGATFFSIMVRVADTDTHCSRAEREGAVILAQPQDFFYGERQYSARDPWGYNWTFTQTIADVDPTSWGGEPNLL